MAMLSEIRAPSKEDAVAGCINTDLFVPLQFAYVWTNWGERKTGNLSPRLPTSGSWALCYNPIESELFSTSHYGWHRIEQHLWYTWSICIRSQVQGPAWQHDGPQQSKGGMQGLPEARGWHTPSAALSVLNPFNSCFSTVWWLFPSPAVNSSGTNSLFLFYL